jgi:hypothetical protein
MKLKIFVNDDEISPGRYNDKFVCNVIEGIIRSVGSSPEKEIFMHINGKKMSVVVDNEYIPLRDDKIKVMIKSTVLGMLSSVDAIPFFDTVDISITLD